jgi:hypothetical protein
MTIPFVVELSEADRRFVPLWHSAEDTLSELGRAARALDRVTVPDGYRDEVRSLMRASKTGPRPGNAADAKQDRASYARRQVRALVRSCGQFRYRMMRLHQWVGVLSETSVEHRLSACTMTSLIERVEGLMKLASDLPLAQ